MRKKFAIFCKSCGSFEVELQLINYERIIAECQNKECNEKEEL